MAIRAEAIDTRIGSCPIGENGRVNIKWLVRHIWEQGFKPRTGKDKPHIDDEAHKVELYTVTVPISKIVVDRTLDDRKQFPPFGLARFNGFYNGQLEYRPVENFHSDSPFTELDTYLRHSLERVANLDYRDTESREDDPKLQSIYEAHTELTYPHDIIAVDQINRGISTATHVIPKLLEVIPKVWAKEYPNYQVSPDELAKTAQKSESLVLSMAGRSKKHLMPLLEVLQYGHEDRGIPFDPDFFTFNKDGGLKFSKKLPKELGKDRKWLRKLGLIKPIIGCPAIYTDAVKKLWGWSVDIAGTIYQTYPFDALSKSPQVDRVVFSSR